MPTVDPTLIPTVQPGNLFNTFTTDSAFNVRWITALEPVYFEIQNRPTVDVVVRQLVIAKAIDAMQLRLGHQSLYPFLIVCKITIGTSLIETPPSWVWDMHVSMPSKWEYVRLAKVKRISGTNGDGSSGSSGSTTPTGKLRLIFSGQQEGSSVEVSLFYVDYIINSLYSYQISRISTVTNAEESNAIDPSEAETIDGFIIMRTLDLTNQTELDFIISLAPPSDQSLNPDGTYVHPAVYEVASTLPGGSSETNDFAQDSLSHGTGLLVVSAYNAIPAIDSDIATWLRATNYPFRVGATRTSTNGITIPSAIFSEFSMIAPAPDEATGDVSMNNSPVWLSSIERLDSLANQLLFTFSTYSIEGDGTTPQSVEVGTITLDRSYISGQVVNIVPLNNLLQAPAALNTEFMQGYGSGHVVLSSIWSGTTSEVSDFFDLFLTIIDVPATAVYNKASAILSSYSLNRIPRTVPTTGQFQAAAGTTERRATPIYPSDNNRVVLEQDIGKGDPIDFNTLAGFPENLRENPDIEATGYKGGIVHPIVTLIVDASGTQHTYDTDVLPRLVCLLGRSPQFGDFWWNGTLLSFFNSDTWISL